MGVNKNEAANILNNSVLEYKGVLWMDFGANETPIEVIKEGAFGGTSIRDIYSGVNEKWYKKVMERIWSVETSWSKILLFRSLWC